MGGWEFDSSVELLFVCRHLVSLLCEILLDVYEEFEQCCELTDVHLYENSGLKLGNVTAKITNL